jgi:hypothetical protein
MAVCLVALLSACSDDSPPDDPPTSTPTASESAGATTPATVATPTLPAAAKADKAGAEAFVRYFWDVFNYTYASGDTKLLRSISDKSCKFCASVADDVDVLTGRGDRTVGATATVHTVVAPPGDPAKGFPVYTRVSQSAGRIVASDGSTKNSSQAQPEQRSDVRVRWINGRWRMLGVSFGGPEETP